MNIPTVTAAEYNELLAECRVLRALCAAAYQVVGASDGPVEMLDNLSDAANGDKLRHEPSAGLPWVPANAAGQAVPDALDENERPDVWNMAYAAGWNDCRKAMLAAAKKQGGDK